MHANQLAHRDLKSANIMMSVRGEVKISMFSLPLSHPRSYLLSFVHTNLFRSRLGPLRGHVSGIPHTHGGVSFLDATR